VAWCRQSAAPCLNLELTMYNDPTDRPLMRVREGALIAGVCGGIA
jgi:hypothetical protein